MPLARGPWKRTTTAQSPSSSPALNASSTSFWSEKQRAGASIIQRSSSTALVLMTARPRLPLTSRRPPSAWNGSDAGRSMSMSALSSALFQTSSSPCSSGLPIQASIESAPAVSVSVWISPSRAERVGDERHPAGVLEVVHVLGAVGIDARDQRHRVGQFREVLPVDQDPGGAGNRRQMDEMVGRAAGREKPDHRVDDRFFVDDAGRAAARRSSPARRADEPPRGSAPAGAACPD